MKGAKKIGRRLACAGAVALVLSGMIGSGLAADDTGSSGEVVFTDYSPLSSNVELARRLLSPLKSAELPILVAQSGKRLRDQPVDLAQEKFVVYVPAGTPPNGYGLLVFVPPWDNARIPDGWAAIFDEYGFIFVSAAQSGNDMNPIARREPLALLAETNVVKRYRVDPDKTFIGGFSGGSRIAMRLALAYPDVFRGAFLDAGSDPIGNAITPIPSRDLFVRFQERSRLVYVTGEQDLMPSAADVASMRSMRAWCVFNTEKRTVSNIGHDAAPPTALAQALETLLAPVVPDERLSSCRATIDQELTGKLQQVQALITSGKTDEARALLTAVDSTYGGLAVPESVELSGVLGLPASQ